MRNKGFIRIMSVLCIALVCLGGFSVTAFAQTPAEETETDDSGVIYDPQPLTPEGNMSLVDDIEGEAAEDKQFIVVQSRNGNYFYIVIDHAAEGEKQGAFLKSGGRSRPVGDYRKRGNRSPACRMQLYRQMRNGQNQYGLPRLQRCYE